MTDVIVENPDPLIDLFIRREYAFEMTYTGGFLVRVGFHKGMWSIGKLKENVLLDRFEIYDTFSSIECPNDVTRGVVMSLIELCPPDLDIGRAAPAWVIVHALKIIIPGACTHIRVLRESRNSFVDTSGALTF